MGQGICDRNPCPKCGGIPTLAIGLLLPQEDQTVKHLVCWKCDMIRSVKRGEEWRPRTGRAAAQYRRRQKQGVK